MCLWYIPVCTCNCKINLHAIFTAQLWKSSICRCNPNLNITEYIFRIYSKIRIKHWFHRACNISRSEFSLCRHAWTKFEVYIETSGNSVPEMGPCPTAFNIFFIIGMNLLQSQMINNPWSVVLKLPVYSNYIKLFCHLK